MENIYTQKHENYVVTSLSVTCDVYEKEGEFTKDQSGLSLQQETV